MDRGIDTLNQAILAEFMRQGLLAPHVRRMRTEVRPPPRRIACSDHPTRAVNHADPGAGRASYGWPPARRGRRGCRGSRLPCARPGSVAIGRLLRRSAAPGRFGHGLCRHPDSARGACRAAARRIAAVGLTGLFQPKWRSRIDPEHPHLGRKERQFLERAPQTRLLGMAVGVAQELCRDEVAAEHVAL